MSRTNIQANGNYSQAAGRDINNIITRGSFIFNPQDLSDLIDKIFSNVETDGDSLKCDFTCINIEEKNKKNGISEEFYKECIQEKVCHFGKIDQFLKNPKYEAYKNKFFGIVESLKPKVLNALQDGKNMQYILSTLFDYFYETNQNCDDDKKPLIMILAYYMYHNCYIGRKK